MTTSVIFDFDKTLSPVYMEHVIFQALHIDEAAFWDRCKIQAQEDTRGWGEYSSELVYMNELLKVAPQLSQQDLLRLGSHIPLFPGVSQFKSALSLEVVAPY